MQKKVLALSIILILTTISLTSISFVQAASDSQWITDYTINDASTNELLVEHNGSTNTTTTFSPVLPGADIKVTFTVERCSWRRRLDAYNWLVKIFRSEPVLVSL